ncbi:MAG TPA: hypothetical protein VL961_10125, partial [Acidimicrobiales bacterium]|nr:hypothetical protein [Acidimicrobiales bacterium]
DLPAELGVTKQAVRQVIDILVSRGYLERHPDLNDRRRVALELTDRGRAVVEATVRAVDAVDHRLEQQVSAEGIGALRTALIALAKIKGDAAVTGAGRRRSASRQMRTFSPLFPVRDLRAALDHYAALGFKTAAYEEGADYGFADRDAVSLHLTSVPPGETIHPAEAYLLVRDADALFEEWSGLDVSGETRPVGPMPYGLREGSHVDGDGNVIRFGSPMEEDE